MAIIDGENIRFKRLDDAVAMVNIVFSKVIRTLSEPCLYNRLLSSERQVPYTEYAQLNLERLCMLVFEHVVPFLLEFFLVEV